MHDYPTNAAERWLNARQARVRAEEQAERHARSPLYIAEAQRQADDAREYERRAQAALERSAGPHDLWATDWSIVRVLP